MKLIQDVCHDVASKYGETIAFASIKEQRTFKTFLEQTEYLAGALQKFGVKKGDRVAILAHNCIDYIAYHYATAMIGAMLLPLNFRLTDAEMLWILNDAEASVLIADENFGEHLAKLRPKCKSIRSTIGIGFVEGADYSTTDLFNGTYKISDTPLLSPKEPVLLIYTSGTTGRPKGALQTHEGSNMIDALMAEVMETSHKDAYLAFLPYFHQAGLIRTRATFRNGGKNIIVGKIDAKELALIIVEKKLSITMLLPPADMLLSEIADRENLKFPSLRLVMGAGGAGPVHSERMRKFCEKFKCRFVGFYGQTEVTGPATVVTGEDYFENPYTCGKPMSGIDCEIWDEKNNKLPPGTVGEIMIRSNTTTPGYWNDDLANEKLYSGRWLHTGDLGKLDENGYLYFVDRKKELIKTGGENVYPREVENVLASHPKISDLAVIGIPDPNGWGELVTAVIVKKPETSLSLEDIIEFCRGKIAGYKIPKKMVALNSIPRNKTGKIMKIELRKKIMKKN